MYVTQTFLGIIANEAKFYVYFLTEGYKGDRQENLYDQVANRIAEYGLSTGPEVAVITPLPGHEKSTLDEIRRNPDAEIQSFYKKHIDGETPGLLITMRPVSEKNAWKGAIFFSLTNVVHPLRESKQIVNGVAKALGDSRFRSALLAMNKFIKLEPNIFGLGLNLNEVIDRILKG